MNESSWLYRVFINFCVTVTIGLLAVMLEYAVFFRLDSIHLKTLGFILISGVIIGILFEVLFVNVFPLSPNNPKRSILWRNRLISAFVNATLVSVLGKFMLGSTIRLLVLILISVAFCLVAVIVIGILSDVRYRHNVKEMNRRLEQLKSLTDGRDIGDGT